MKAKHKIRALRALAIAGSMSALVVPSAASAMLPRDAVQQPSTQQSYQLPSQFRTEVQTPSSTTSAKPFQLRASFHPEVQTPSSPTVASNPGSVIREIRTVTDDGSPTLAIVLAAIALGIALGGSSYGWVRLTRMQRNLSSRALVG
jgi:uncharacterized protein HemX